ncbi:AGE family epimerase/isomerase [Poseidonocella sedimentorum]|uniref:Mannose or cellobiose epimerase, N-acyl-D-glucosamine 2-epimerase family n=1 Tax=Poseidonocella sedimentorum TaxID=871652 RepID=A0A1I6E9K9_9RHOB|nr:AGE family epimerase/isomerase [Poseidonocella sedimentorum]SFR14251.1 Mannose or cellobiose epimerase, N-acyl-D-glucosamine 2-epimerase family [Poseidonocella sedimentorum]
MSHETQAPGDPDQTGPWLEDPAHLDWLREDALRQLEFFRASLRPDGGFDVLDLDGAPLGEGPQELHTTTRMVHSYALAHAAGAPDCAGIVEAGLAYLQTHHRDAEHGGFFWSVRRDGAPVRDEKLAYGHVFVLLAASTARAAGFAGTEPLLAEIAALIDRRFWDDAAGLLRDEFTRDWQPFSDYRGYNSNMHGCEAFLAAFEATGERAFLDKAGRILDFFLTRIAPDHGWRLPEHFTPDWEVDLDYAGDPMFRPKGTTPGHSLELARLALQHWDLAGRADAQAPDRARRLAEQALRDAWRPEGGLVYTLDYSGAVQVADRYWWPVCEGIGALAALQRAAPEPADERWYRTLWASAAALFVDEARGGWFPEVDDAGRPAARQFLGKPDIYHALQADVLPLSGAVSRPVAALAKTRPLAPR